MYSFNRDISPERYLKVFLMILLLLLIITGIIMYKIYDDKSFADRTAIDQKGRLFGKRNIETIFIGDSSCRRTIDEDLFSSLSGTKSLNLGLSAIYGFGGPYCMLKKAYENNKIKNVIIMVNLGMLYDESSNDYTGLLYSMDSWSDISELTYGELSATLVSGINIVFSSETMWLAIKSYLGLGTLQVIRKESEMYADKISLDTIITPSYGTKERDNVFLYKIISFCKKNNINLIFVYGPAWHKVVEKSRDYIEISNKLLRSTGILLIDNIQSIDDYHIGNTEYHISPSSRKLYTERYYNLIKPFLVVK
jgi:hypothetical protein